MKKLISAALLLAASATAGTAATFNLGLVDGEVTLNETLAGPKTLDYFKFSIVPGKPRLAITATTSGTSNQYRTEIALYGDDDKLIKFSGQGSPTSKLVFMDSEVPTDDYFTLVFGAWNSVFTENLADARSNAFPSGDYSLTIQAVPLPAGGLMLMSGAAGLVALRRKKRAQA